LFLGYSTLHKGYKCLHLPTNRLFISQDVVFTESTFPYTSAFSKETSSPNSRQPFSLPLLSYPLAASILQPSTASIPYATPLLSTPLQSPQSESVTSAESSFVPIILEVPSPALAPQESIHPMVTHAKNNISKPREFTNGRVQYLIPRALLAESSSLIIEPTCHSLAIKDKNWRAAMNTEFDALLHNQTWTLVPLTSATNVIGCE
jgi:hypothetical protein